MAPQVNPKGKLKTYLLGHLIPRGKESKYNVPKERDVESQKSDKNVNGAEEEEMIPLREM